MFARKTTSVLPGFLTLFVLAAFAVVPAQAQQPTPQSAPELDREAMETFAEAYLEIDEVRMEMQTRLQNVQDADQANQIQQEANSQMREVLDEHEISIEEYQQITQVLNTDPEQREEFQAIVEELSEEEGAPAPR